MDTTNTTKKHDRPSFERLKAILGPEEFLALLKAKQAARVICAVCERRPAIKNCMCFECNKLVGPIELSPAVPMMAVPLPTEFVSGFES